MHTTGKPSQHEESTGSQKGNRVASRRGTGPRTVIGKERVKYNALKHGLFAKAILLPREDQAQFNDLLSGLQRALTPKGTLEDVLIEKIATILWRYRRLLQAESANVQENIEDQEDDSAGLSREGLRIHAHLEKVRAETNRRGTLPEIDDYPESLEDCLDKLYNVAEDADRYGLECGAHRINLGLVYGARYAGRPGKDLFDYYLECLSAVTATATERERKGFESEVDCAQKFIAATEKEILRLESHRKRPAKNPTARALTDEDKPRFDLLELSIPDSGHLDRSLRVEANLERALDRALIQLERLQRIRDSQKTIEVLLQR